MPVTAGRTQEGALRQTRLDRAALHVRCARCSDPLPCKPVSTRRRSPYDRRSRVLWRPGWVLLLTTRQSSRSARLRPCQRARLIPACPNTSLARCFSRASSHTHMGSGRLAVGTPSGGLTHIGPPQSQLACNRHMGSWYSEAAAASDGPWRVWASTHRHRHVPGEAQGES